MKKNLERKRLLWLNLSLLYLSVRPAAFSKSNFHLSSSGDWTHKSKCLLCKPISFTVSFIYYRSQKRDKEIEYRIGSARGTFSQLRKLSQIQNLNLKRRVVFLYRQSIVRSRLSYKYHTRHETRSETTVNCIQSFSKISG